MFSIFFGPKIDKAHEASINTLVKQIIDDFQQLFNAAYIDELAAHIIREGTSGGKDSKRASNRAAAMGSLLLEKAPPRTEVLKQGYMTKQGGMVKNWTKRNFIVWNASSNYKIEYFEGRTLKGIICGAGYSVAAFDQQDVEKYGPHGLKLIPFQPFRRIWYLRSDDEQQREQWLMALQHACFKNESEDHVDPVVASSFKIAFEFLRYKYNFNNYYKSYGKETERLTDFIHQILLRDLSLEGVNDEAIESVVKLAVNLFWGKSVNSLTTTSNKHDLIRENAALITSQRQQLRTRILVAIKPQLDAFVSLHETSTFRPILEAVLDPVTQAFAQTVRSLFSTLSALLIDRKIINAETKKQHLKELVTGLDFFWNSDTLAYWPAQILINMFNDQTLEVIFRNASYPASTVSRLAIDSVTELMHGTLLTFDKLSDQHDGTAFSKYNANLVSTIRTCIHDAKLTLKYTLVETLRCMIRKPMMLFLASVTSDVAALQLDNETSSATVTAAIAPYLTSNRLLLDAVQQHLEDFIIAFVKPYQSECDESVDQVESELAALPPRESMKVSARDKNLLLSPRMSVESYGSGGAGSGVPFGSSSSNAVRQSKDTEGGGGGSLVYTPPKRVTSVRIVGNNGS